MWHKVSDLAKYAINRSGVRDQVDAERIIQTANFIGKEQFNGLSFRNGVLVIAVTDGDPVTVQADALKIQNTLNKILKSKIIKRVRVINS